MKYFATIYIDPITDWQGFTHAFLGLTHIHPDELDEIDKELRDEKLKNADWKDFDKKWYEKIYPTINPYVFTYDSKNDEGFFGFGSATGMGKMIWDKFVNDGSIGKVFENNQYIVSPNKKTNIYDNAELRSNRTFFPSNRCTLEISKEQYETLFQSIQQDIIQTSFVGPQGVIKNENFIYDIKNNNCVHWAIKKLLDIGIEIIDEDYIPGNFMECFPSIMSIHSTFLKFQAIDSNLESIKGAKAFRDWARTMIDNNYICCVDKKTLENKVQVFCKKNIENQRYYESIKKFYTLQIQLKSIYDKLDALLEKIIQKINTENIKGDFEFIYWDKQENKIKSLKAENDYNPIAVENFDLNIPANNCSISKFYPFIFIPRDKILSRMLYHKYDYGKVSESYQKAANEFYLNVLAGIQSDKYWSKSYHKLSKINKQFQVQTKEIENV